jgi:hypothetical protein
MTVSTEDQVDGVVRFHLIKNIGRMGQKQRKALVRPSRKTAQVSAVERWIIDADDHQLSPSY